MATAISSLPNEVSKNEVVSMVEKNTEAAVIKEIKYLHDYKNDELVKVFADQLKVPIVKI